jgi:hypothetical protein
MGGLTQLLSPNKKAGIKSYWLKVQEGFEVLFLSPDTCYLESAKGKGRAIVRGAISKVIRAR